MVAETSQRNHVIRVTGPSMVEMTKEIHWCLTEGINISREAAVITNLTSVPRGQT
jgi:hypothetical protein